MRVFTAIDIETPRTLEKLTEIQEQLDYGFNTIKPEKMHITLQFFQNIGSGQVQEIEKGMDQVELDGFNAKIKGVGTFPSRSHIRVVWAGIEAKEIFKLKKQVSNHSVPEDNGHDFHPHITLARVKDIPRNSKKQFRQRLEELKQKEIAEITVDKIKLFESIHNGKNTEYRTLKERKL